MMMLISGALVRVCSYTCGAECLWLFELTELGLKVRLRDYRMTVGLRFGLNYGKWQKKKDSPLYLFKMEQRMFACRKSYILRMLFEIICCKC